MTEQELELKYSNMTHQQVQHEIMELKKEAARLEFSIASKKMGLERLEAVQLRIHTINDGISHHERELCILRKQKRLVEQEAKMLCA